MILVTHAHAAAERRRRTLAESGAACWRIDRHFIAQGLDPGADVPADAAVVIVLTQVGTRDPGLARHREAIAAV